MLQFYGGKNCKDILGGHLVKLSVFGIVGQYFSTSGLANPFSMSNAIRWVSANVCTELKFGAALLDIEGL